ncbi:hypothetical protein O6H91_01G095300 [Diphasiastrum complanatum]|uniref:Uncharacterized protein n=1 Tax=Diphasiastrum complanatum TaxID=34168 RepID=A0ACC2ETL5_DIPCM|nr:hypothetical protein O6H91_01G095300 [Diphasiastrum complanatum]
MMMCQALFTRSSLRKAAAIDALKIRTVLLFHSESAVAAIPAPLEARPLTDAEIISALRDSLQKPSWTKEIAKELDLLLYAAKPKAYHISEALKQQRNVSVALDFFGWVKRQPWYTPNPYIYTILINSLGRGSDLGVIQQMVQSMKTEGCAFTTVTYNTLIRIFGKAKQLDEVSRVYKEMQEAGCKPDSYTFGTLISVYYTAGVPEKVVDAYDDMIKESDQSTDVIYEMVISSLAKVGKLDRACKIFEEMLEKGFKPSAVLYFTMVIFLAKAGKLDLGMKFYGAMQDAGHKAGLGTYCALIESYAKSGRLELSMKLYKDMQAAAFEPNLSLYSTLLESHAKAGKLDVAMGFYNDMRNVGLWPSPHIYAALVEFSVRGGKPDVAVQLYKDMREVGLRPPQDTFRQVIAAIARSGNLKDAENILNEMKVSGFRVDDIFMEVLMGFLDEGNVALGGRLFLKAQALNIQPNIRVYRQLLHGLIEEKMYSAAKQVVISMLNSASGIDLRSYCVIFRHFVKCSEEQHEKPLLQLMRIMKHPAHSFLCKLLQGPRQEQSLSDLVSLFYTSPAMTVDLKSKRYFTNLLMNYLVLMGQQRLASCVWRIASEANIYPDVIQFKTDLVWSLYVKNMSVGTTLIATLCTLESFRERILKRRFVPQRIKILTGLRDDSSSSFVREAVEKMLRPLDSPFQFNDAPLGCLWCRGASFVKWFRLPYVREVLRAKGTLQRPVPVTRF